MASPDGGGRRSSSPHQHVQGAVVPGPWHTERGRLFPLLNGVTVVPLPEPVTWMPAVSSVLSCLPARRVAAQTRCSYRPEASP